MKSLFSVFIVIFTLSLTLPSAAQEPKLIQLKDGSTLSGHVIELNHGIYTIKTDNLGIMKIREDNILSISNKRMAARSSTETAAAQTETPSAVLTKSNLNSQVQTMQQNLLSDPDMMKDIQEMMSDPEIVQILSDKAFMNSIMNLDMNAIEQHPQYMKLMHNYKMRSLIEKVKNKQN